MNYQPRAWLRQNSGRRLNLLNPDPDSWTDDDLATGLSRTFRWGGHSKWPLPLSVAQHSLLVLELVRRASPKPLTRAQELRELLHDAEEALIGGFDPVSPIKPILGEGFKALTTRLQKAVFTRYGLVDWDETEYKLHKQADTLSAASEAVHVAGWAEHEVKEVLDIDLKPLIHDPLAEIYDCKSWEPWPLELAAERFLSALTWNGESYPIDMLCGSSDIRKLITRQSRFPVFERFDTDNAFA